MPIDYSRYPPHWKTQIRPAILQRAKNKCEWCGLPNYAFVVRKNGTTSQLTPEQAEDARQAGERVTRIVLTIAHLNHNINDNRHANLAALCQRCHLSHDAPYHAKNAARTRREKRLALGQLELL
jgi:5-methylcytosine-specific restriction endonuclease McrA